MSRPAIWKTVAFALGLLLSVAAPSSAADDTAEAANAVESADHDSHSHDADHGAHGDTVRGKPHGRFGTLPEFLYIDGILFVWTLAVFALLAVLLRYLAWGPILKALNHREEAVRQSHQQAKLARAEARELLQQHDQEMGQAHEQAKAMLEDARETAARECEELISKARLQAAQAQEKAEADIEQAKNEALQQIRESAVERAAQIAGRVADKGFAQNDFRHLLEDRQQ